jgi:hypothetical protein
VTGPKLPKPQALDVVPASEVGALIEETDRVFVDLERELQAVNAEAAEVEALAAVEGIDPSASTWTMVRLQRFLDDLREEARRDAAATIGVAEQRVRVERADALQARGLAVAPAPAFAPPTTTAPTDVPRPVPTSDPGAGPVVIDDEPTSVVAPSTVAAGGLVFAATASEPRSRPVAEAHANGNGFAPQVPSVRTAGALDASAPVQAPVVARETSTGIVDAAPVVVTPLTPLFGDPAPPPAPAPQPATAPQSASPLDGDGDFWQPNGTAPITFDQAAPPLIVPVPPAPPQDGVESAPATEAHDGKRSKRRSKKQKAPKPPKAQKPPKDRRGVGSVAKKLPVAAILEVIAVLLILVFILLRLS